VSFPLIGLTQLIQLADRVPQTLHLASFKACAAGHSPFLPLPLPLALEEFVDNSRKCLFFPAAVVTGHFLSAPTL
jgi:hypothetical protein